MVHLADRYAHGEAGRTPRHRQCEWPGCACDGEFPAPRSRDESRPFRWFCLEHVRAYNASWNYYEGMSESEIEADRRSDTVWQRPTWRLGGASKGRTFEGVHVRDDFGFFDEATKPPPCAPSGPEQEAMSVLDLSPPVTLDTVKARYKQLVKRHHPDANGGDKNAEERFKVINAAYRTVLDSLAD